MNVYDFDNTVYDGESFIQFFLYFLKLDKSLLKYAPEILVAVIKYKRGALSIEQALSQYGGQFTEYFAKTISGGLDLEWHLEHFWDMYANRIKPFYAEVQRDDDLIISCSPEFSLKVICRRLGIKHYIGTVVDEKTGVIERMCFRENKVKAFKELYPGCEIDALYTDSVNDSPLMEISKEVYLVKGDKITKIK